MNISLKMAGLGAMVFATLLAGADANASGAVRPSELAALSAEAPAMTLPDVTIDRNLTPYDSGQGPKVSGHHFIPYTHYQVPPGYDSMAAMHPYTSGLGVCTEGATPAQGCHHPTGTPIPPSHYERAPFNQ